MPSEGCEGGSGLCFCATCWWSAGNLWGSFGLQMHHHHLCTLLHMAVPLCVPVPSGPLYISSPVILDQGPTLPNRTSTQLITSATTCISKGPILRSWKSGFQHMIFEGHNSTHINLLYLCLARAVFHTQHLPPMVSLSLMLFQLVTQSLGSLLLSLLLQEAFPDPLNKCQQVLIIIV